MQFLLEVTTVTCPHRSPLFYLILINRELSFILHEILTNHVHLKAWPDERLKDYNLIFPD